MTIEALAPLFTGTGAKPVNTDLYDQVVAYITDAKNVRTLGKISDRMDQLLSEKQLTAAQHDALTELVRQRHEAIEPAKEVADGVA